MDVSSTNILITAPGSRGAYWATRTLLQGLVLTGGLFPTGEVVDQPDWRTRGFMLGQLCASEYTGNSVLTASRPIRRRKAVVSDYLPPRPVHVCVLVQTQRVRESTYAFRVAMRPFTRIHSTSTFRTTSSQEAMSMPMRASGCAPRTQHWLDWLRTSTRHTLEKSSTRSRVTAPPAASR